MGNHESSIRCLYSWGNWGTSRSNLMWIYKEFKTEDIDLRDTNTLNIVEELGKWDDPDISKFTSEI